ncbi:MAG: hypothetical protein GW762_05815 [Candidatus Pacebacteria bacterium]|nr:hypothetical protein [Candidatus Paceibacterota bacterium]PIR63224.1 MAG: hypothetical protein COU64_05910 [Candidatus Pacebacteria bacterium CG10_big_fil_rev_8_21_14_0_10_40_26]PIZ78254.1 MAG: hypothetical protein COY01_05730 [Candidatus Pacebacteria bacterium CG_4_10_14_0_2_um_filter_40_20]PJA68701.1 MAG: hypothetical protein CO156_04315 [Candidatus Pacebacteria bacterium CG_4_9_14_3_um_filter_40_12]PJC41641.1 MAG: hypothetical protein CO041_02905 [Candidatus Pacebacteria bacterium CG_4_9_
MWPLKKSLSKASSRNQIAIKEVRDGILVLPNNEHRLVIETSSVNFELKSEAEQDILIDSFQTFLNSLPSQLQILIRIREVDIDLYVDSIELLKQSEDEKKYLEQIDDYTQFIRQLVSGNKILSRKFYIVLPYKPDSKSDVFELAQAQLTLTQDMVIKSLEKLGMKARKLDSLEVLHLFYSFYNKNQLKTQELTSTTMKAILQHNYV